MKNETLEGLKKAIKLRPHDPYLWMLLGDYYDGLDEIFGGEKYYGKAETCYKKALERDPQSLSVLYRIVKKMMDEENPDAELYYKKILEIDADDYIGNKGLADLYELYHETEKAKFYREIAAENALSGKIKLEQRCGKEFVDKMFGEENSW